MTAYARRRRHRVLHEQEYQRWLAERRAFYGGNPLWAHKGEDTRFQRRLFNAYQRNGAYRRSKAVRKI